jgi:hypothetical protein
MCCLRRQDAILPRVIFKRYDLTTSLTTVAGADPIARKLAC